LRPQRSWPLACNDCMERLHTPPRLMLAPPALKWPARYEALANWLALLALLALGLLSPG